MEQRKENDVVMDDVVEGGRKAGLASLRRRGREGASSGGGCLERRGLGEEKTYRERGLRTVVCRSRREAWKGKCELGMVLERRGVGDVFGEKGCVKIGSEERAYGVRCEDGRFVGVDVKPGESE